MMLIPSLAPQNSHSSPILYLMPSGALIAIGRPPSWPPSIHNPHSPLSCGQTQLCIPCHHHSQPIDTQRACCISLLRCQRHHHHSRRTKARTRRRRRRFVPQPQLSTSTATAASLQRSLMNTQQHPPLVAIFVGGAGAGNIALSPFGIARCWYIGIRKKVNSINWLPNN